MIEQAPMPLSMYSNYLACVQEAIEQEPSQWTFKSDWRYREILEHTPVEFADVMLKWSQEVLPGLDLDHVRVLAELNDSVGMPIRALIRGLGTYSPGNMRYLCHAIKLWQHIDSLGLDEVEVVEIGGGYGGLALWVRGVRGLSDQFKTKLGAYWIVDLPEVTRLQYQTLQQVGAYITGKLAIAFPVDGTNPKVFEVFEERAKSLVCFSAYAFSEFDQVTRDWYAERLLPYCRHGLMIWNFPEALRDADGQRYFGGPPYQFINWPMLTEPDVPALYDGHLQITW